jgi:glycosyltransferase involved in cell wall biosynthesis
MNNPKVSIIMATYNRSQFIFESLLSIQNQTFSDWECLIIDDGGTDNTLEVITPLLEKDYRFKYFLRTNDYLKGLPGTRNYGLDIAKGDFIIFFDDDDLVHPLNLELCLFELNKNDVSYCRYLREVFFGEFKFEFDLSKEYASFFIDENDILRVLNYELPFNSCAVLWKKECFLNHRYVEHLKYSEEWELYSRILTSGIKGISIEKTLFYGRKHLNSVTGNFNTNNPHSRKSYTDAILLVISDLKEKKLLSYCIIRYFMAISINFKEYALFEKILTILELSKLEQFKWRFFFAILPIRLSLYRMRKAIK